MSEEFEKESQRAEDSTTKAYAKGKAEAYEIAAFEVEENMLNS